MGGGREQMGRVSIVWGYLVRYKTLLPSGMRWAPAPETERGALIPKLPSVRIVITEP